MCPCRGNWGCVVAVQQLNQKHKIGFFRLATITNQRSFSAFVSFSFCRLLVVGEEAPRWYPGYPCFQFKRETLRPYGVVSEDMENAGAKPFKARGRVKVTSDVECQVGAADCVELWGLGFRV